MFKTVASKFAFWGAAGSFLLAVGGITPLAIAEQATLLKDNPLLINWTGMLSTLAQMREGWVIALLCGLGILLVGGGSFYAALSKCKPWPIITGLLFSVFAGMAYQGAGTEAIGCLRTFTVYAVSIGAVIVVTTVAFIGIRDLTSNHQFS